MISKLTRAAPRYLSDLFRNGTPAGLSDAELLDRFASRRGEHNETAELAFAALLARHGPMVLRVCRGVLGDRHEVDDAFQATFLVLAVRARSIRRRDSVASWLHGVALRVAAAERSRTARSRRLDRARATMIRSTTDDAGSDPMCDNERTVIIQEEIGRLPKKYRAAVVLCYLEGLTHEMAAERLGWPVGSVKSRLAWARERLRGRLTRRGVGPTGLAFDRSEVSKSAEPASLLIGTRLADTTLRGALQAGMGKGALVGTVSAEAVALMEGIIKSMASAKLMLMATAALLAGLVTAGVGVMGYSAICQENPARAGAPGQDARQPVSRAPVTQGPPRPAVAKPVTDQGPLLIQVDVVDPEGHRVSGADVVFWVVYPRDFGNVKWVIERTRSDNAGHVKLEVAREHAGATVRATSLWAFQAGRSLATSGVFLRGKTSPLAVQLTLDEPPKKWNITVLGPDDQPIAGLRLTPDELQSVNGRTGIIWTVPDALLEPLTVTTDAKGVAKLTYLPEIMTPRSIRVAGPGVAPHILKLGVPKGKDIALKLGRSGRVVGIVRTASGQPLANVPVDLWVQGWGTGYSARTIQHRTTPDAMVRFDPHPLKTGPQGAFQTPPVLLNGSSYRVSIRRDGFAPFISEWVTLNGERVAIPAIRLQPLVKLTGRIEDRQGHPVAGARVFLPAGGPRAAADAQGRFTLAGINPRTTVVLVEQTGFRLQGWLVDPSAQAEVGSLTLVRAGEGPGPVMKPLADPIMPEESRALADRLLEPYLRDPVENESDWPRLAAISALSEFDLDHAVELLQDGKVRGEDRQFQGIRELMAAKLAMKDPARAEAMIESIPDPLAKVSALTAVARALPVSEHVRKQALLERAATLFRDRLQQANAKRRLRLVAAIARQWLDIGQRDRARLLLQAEKTSGAVFETGFLGQLARLEPDKTVARSRELPALNDPSYDPSYRDRELTEVATQLAIDTPAQAEQVFDLRGGGHDQLPSLPDTLRLCRGLGRVDPARARRVAASLGGPGIRACGWAFVALGLAEKDKAGASDAIDRAIQEIDRLRESGQRPEPVTNVGGLLMYPTNPAAAILPVVERVAPERLTEVFWRAVALYPLIEPDREDLLRSPYIGFECMLLARYDRQVAAALFQPINCYLSSLAAGSGPRDEYDPGVVAAMGCIDPRSAVALIESLTPPRDSRRSDPAHEARFRLAEVLGLPAEKRWMRMWSSVGAQLDD